MREGQREMRDWDEREGGKRRAEERGRGRRR